MAWYVFALVDRIPSRAPARGLSAPLSFRRAAGAYAAVERRADVPPVEFGVLQKHQRIVCRLAAAVPAILPVRFGTLLEAEEIDEALADREEEVAEALDSVRDRVQFTWRIGRPSNPPSHPAGAAAGQGSGTEYLRQLAAPVAPPRSLAFIRSRLRSFAVAEKYQQATATVPQSLYHLVDDSRVDSYERAASVIQASRRGAVVTGPWPPFAFAPEVL
jgi:Gas vesicle synthesis protein GvpL/GvpF